MTDLPHVTSRPWLLGEEHRRALNAYCREHNLSATVRALADADVVNAAVDWWNALGTETGEEEGA